MHLVIRGLPLDADQELHHAGPLKNMPKGIHLDVRSNGELKAAQMSIPSSDRGVT